MYIASTNDGGSDSHLGVARELQEHIEPLLIVSYSCILTHFYKNSIVMAKKTVAKNQFYTLDKLSAGLFLKLTLYLWGQILANYLYLKTNLPLLPLKKSSHHTIIDLWYLATKVHWSLCCPTLLCKLWVCNKSLCVCTFCYTKLPIQSS